MAQKEDDFVPTFVNPSRATDAFIKRQAMEKLMEMMPAVRSVVSRR